MGRGVLVLTLSVVLLGGCGHGVEPTPGTITRGVVLVDVPTSPAGFSGNAPAAGLLQAIVQHGRAFRGNPLSLGIFTGILLVVALGLGAYTIRLTYRHPHDDHGR